MRNNHILDQALLRTLLLHLKYPEASYSFPDRWAPESPKKKMLPANFFFFSIFPHSPSIPNGLLRSPRHRQPLRAGDLSAETR